MVARNGSNEHTNYEQKFADYIRLLAESKDDVVMIHHPEVLGDNYEELVESLNRLADAGKHLTIAPTKQRGDR